MFTACWVITFTEMRIAREISFLKSLMPLLTPRSVALWLWGYLTARLVQFAGESTPASLELAELSRDLRLTRTAIEEYSDCENSLRTEIRYSTTLNVTLRGILFVEAILVIVYLGLETVRLVCNRYPVLSVQTLDNIRSGESSSSEEPPVESPVPVSRTGPLRPSDLRRWWRLRLRCWHWTSLTSKW